MIAHPDLHVVQPESKSRRIVIDQIRELEHSIQRKPLVGGSKVAIIHDADRMQPQAANAFLKTLEEPPPGSLILLLSTVPEAILETVLSRCVETACGLRRSNESTPEERPFSCARRMSYLEKQTRTSRGHSGWHELFRIFLRRCAKGSSRARKHPAQGDRALQAGVRRLFLVRRANARTDQGPGRSWSPA